MGKLVIVWVLFHSRLSPAVGGGKNSRKSLHF